MRFVALWIGVLTVLAVSNVHAQVGEKAWFVRPAAECAVNGDGLSQACATVAGGPGAISSFANIPWSQVAGGNTLFVCGPYTTQLNVAVSGLNGSPIIINGACPGNRGTINTIGGSNVDSAILMLNVNHIVVRGFDRDGKGLAGNRSAILMYASVPQDDIKITRNRIDNRLSASQTNVCNGVAADGIAIHTRIVITYNTVMGTAQNCGGTSNSDAINLIRLTSGLIAWNDLSGAEGGLDLDGTVEGVDIYGNWAHDNRVNGLKVFGGNACPIGPLRVQQNLFVNNGRWAAIWQNQHNGIFADNTLIQFHDAAQSGGPPYGGLQIENPISFNGTQCNLTGNTYIGNIILANWQYGVMINYSETRESFETNNTWQGNLLFQMGVQTPIVWFGTPLTPTSQVNAGNYDVWKKTHIGDMNAQPQFVNVNGCVSQATVTECQNADFHLISESVYKNQGPYWTKECVGVNGIECVPPVQLDRVYKYVVAPKYIFDGTLKGTIQVE